MAERRLLSNQPVVAALEGLEPRYGRVRAVAKEAGVSERSLHRHLSGDASHIRRGNAEAIIEALERLQRERL